MGLLTSLFQTDLRAGDPSLENPRFTLQDESARLYLGGEPSSSGVRINDRTALAASPWWRGLNLIADTIAKTPLLVQQRLGDDRGWQTDRDHPAYRLLRRLPNPYQTDFEWKRLMTGHAVSAGSGYSYIYRAGDAAPLELWPLDPHATYPVREQLGLVTRLWYITEVNGAQHKLLAEDVLHLKGYSWDGMQSFGVAHVAREALGLALAARKYQALTFRNAGRPGVVLEAPNKLDQKARTELRESWERMHAGLDNSHRTAVLDNGLKLNSFSFSPEDAQLILGMEFNLIDIANFLKLPPHKVGANRRTSYASLEQENQACLDECFDPWMVLWEAECWNKLLTEEEKDADSHAVEFLRAALVRANATDRATYNRTALAGRPWMTQNEVREREALPHDEDPKADEILEPLNMGKTGGADHEPAPPGKDNRAKKPPGDPPQSGGQVTPPATLADAFAPMKAALAKSLGANFEDAARRVCRRIGVHARRTSKESKAYCNWLDTFREEHADVVRGMLAPAIDAIGILLRCDIFPVDVTTRALALLHQPLFALTEFCTPAELPGRVESLMAELEATLPVALARELMEAK